MLESRENVQLDRNRAIVDALPRAGGEPGGARDLYHWIFFDSGEDLAAFRNIIVSLDFTVRHDSTCLPDSRAEEDDPGFVLSISRAETLDLDRLNALTRELGFLAEEWRGEYDGPELGGGPESEQP